MRSVRVIGSQCAQDFFEAPGANLAETATPAERAVNFLCKRCPANGATCNAGLVVNKPEFWVYKDPDGQEVTSHRCPAHFCTVRSRDQSQSSSIHCIPFCLLAQSSATGCAPGRQNASSNILCGKCLDGYAEWSNQCVSESFTWGSIYCPVRWV